MPMSSLSFLGSFEAKSGYQTPRDFQPSCCSSSWKRLKAEPCQLSTSYVLEQCAKGD